VTVTSILFAAVVTAVFTERDLSVRRLRRTS